MKISIPYNFEQLFHELEQPGNSYQSSYKSYENLDDIEVELSITQHLELILLTKCGEFSFDRNFGFKFWEQLFNNISVENFKSNMIFHVTAKKEFTRKLQKKGSAPELRKDDYIKLLKDLIEKYEPRLSSVNISLNMEIEKGYNNIFKYLNVIVSGKIDKHYPYKKEFKIKIGPIEKKY